MAIPIRKVLDETRTLLAEHPELGRTATVARADLVDQVRTRVHVGRHTFETDEAQVAGGQGTAPSPIELALGALAACEAVAFRYWAELLDLPLDAVTVRVRGEGDLRGFFGFDPSVPSGLTAIRVSAEVRGPRTGPARRYGELHDAVQSHGPLLVALAHGVPIQSQLVIR